MSVQDMFAKQRAKLSSSDASPDPVPAKKNAKQKTTVEEIYQKKSQLEHILLRPDTYIGSVEPVKESQWIYDSEEEKMVQKEIQYVPGLYKIFDEILVNACDNKQRDSTMNTIKIDIDGENNVISVWNNGKGIPVVEHKEEKMMVPTMIFGHLLTSSNYNDEEEKVTGGRNGYGAKLCNIFSTLFTVETASKEYKLKFKQTWAKNMSKTTEPKVTEFTGTDYTKITFSPDLTKFKMTSLDKDTVDLLSRRAFDAAASTRGVKVILNGKPVAVKSFKDYVELYIKGKEDDTGNPLKIVYEQAGERWEVAVTLSENDFQHMSFVNSIATTKGGRHVDHVTDLIVKKLLEVCNKKNKAGMQLKASQIKNHMWVFINCLIVNPTFDSQTKTHMTLQLKSFGSKCVLSEKFIAAVNKCGIIESVLSWAKFKAEAIKDKKCSGKKATKLKGIAKLEDANDAGTKNSVQCTLILTEGDSAKSLAVSGLGVVGRDKYGVFPLRGKLLNVREASHKQILENIEINNLIKILGLQYKRKYETMEDLRTLRYGKVMIMTDQDQDGSHIKGLIINFIHHNWPSLLRLPFLEEFITPIVKATKGKEEISFYSLPEFEDWKKATPNFHLYKTKYYKGLGTSTSKEAKEYFQDMKRHRILFNHDGPTDDYNINMAFSKKCVDQRKEWLTSWMQDCKTRRETGLGETYLYHKNTTAVSYSDFINKELVLFSNLDNERSIPCVVDGLKPGQRKVLFTCIKRNDKKEVKVAQLAGSVAEHSAYHHGEQSLMSTIINLAQNYVGSNNINLLMPNGQFGTRLQGGKDAASPRYIFTQLNPVTSNQEDWPLFTLDDGSQPPVRLASRDRNIIAATFAHYLLRNIGGSETFKDKQEFFYHEVRKLHQKHHHDRQSVRVYRDRLLESSFKATRNYSVSDWCRSFDVTFHGEDALDWGGVRREWFNLVCSCLFDSRNGLFTAFSKDQQALVLPNPKRASHLKLKHFEFAGKIVGKCLYESALGDRFRQLVRARFSRSFLAQLIGLRVHYKYLEQDDPDLYIGKIKYIEENDIDTMDLYFAEEEYCSNGQLVKTVDLIPNGSKIRVTNETKEQYLDCLAQYRLATNVKDEVDHFLKGLNDLIPDSLLSIFDENELELLLCGTGEYNIADFRANHNSSGRTVEFRRVLDWFWTAVSNFTQEEMARLLQFITGCSQLPPGGFAELSPKITISAAPTVGRLPTAHTCFNQLCLPDYDTYEQFEKALILAITEGSEGFALV